MLKPCTFSHPSGLSILTPHTGIRRVSPNIARRETGPTRGAAVWFLDKQYIL